MSKIQVFRLRALDKELAEILQEADGRCSTAFSLGLDGLRERLQVPITATSRSEARIVRRIADKDAKDNPIQDERGMFKFTTADQQEKLSDAMTDFLQSEIEIPDDLQRITKRELMNNGLSVSGLRIANLRPVLDVALDEPVGQTSGERTVFLTHPPRGTPNA